VPVAPWYVGQTFQPLVFHWTKDDAARTPVDPTGKTLELWFRSVDTGRKFKATGTFTIVNGPTGDLTFTLSTTDVAVADDYVGQVKMYPVGQPTNPYYSDIFPFPLQKPLDLQ
jgi:hypothetical protein